MKEAKPRYAFIDALRGVAALGVLLAHIVGNEVTGKTLTQFVPSFLKAILYEGNFGVEIFFVLSGFVIALSLSQGPLTWPKAVNFAIRRELRLDLPYFAALFLMAALHAFFGRGFPDLRTIALNLVYLHNIVSVITLGDVFKIPQILGVAWTLCLEVQFYAAFLLILALDRWLGKPKDGPVSSVAVTVVWVTALISCALVQIGKPVQLYTFAPYSWFYFAAGATCFWCWRGWAPVWALGLVALGMTASAMWAILSPGDSYVTASFEGIESGLIATLLIFYFAGKGQLETLSLGKVGQFLGRISYSLYLTHAITVEATMWLTHRLWGGSATGALISLIIVVPMVLLIAQGFYFVFEKPSVKLAARFKRT